MTEPAGPTAAATTPLPDLVLYGRDGCHLCDEARDVVLALLDERRAADRPTPRLVERDITTDPAWELAYGDTIPVVELADRRLELATSPTKVGRLLADVLDSAQKARP